MKNTLRSEQYPAPLAQHSGHGVWWYVYDNKYDAMKASVIAEQAAISRWAQGQDFVYSLPGQIIPNKDGTFTVVVV